mgnify:CR=1 FL=1
MDTRSPHLGEQRLKDADMAEFAGFLRQLADSVESGEMSEVTVSQERDIVALPDKLSETFLQPVQYTATGRETITVSYFRKRKTDG